MKRVCYECLIVLTVVKPAVDAKRVAGGGVQKEGCVFSPYEILAPVRLDGILGWLVTAIFREMIKIVTDSTLIIQSRPQIERSRAYWSANVAMNQAFCFVSVYL